MLSFLIATVVSAVLDSTVLFIGDQTDLHLQVTTESSAKIGMPIYGENLITDIEIVDRTIVDTTILPDGQMQLNQYLTLTSFKDSLFYIPAIPFVEAGDTLFSEPLVLNVVQPFEMDTTNAITDIKNIVKAPVWVWEIVRWVLLAVLLIGIAVGLYFFVPWLKRKLAHEDADGAEKVVLRPAEEVALERLDKIKEEKVWQSGQVKEYQTQLTDVIREYISRRFDVSSTEKTSDETLRAMKPVLAEQRELYSKLQRMLSLADLVKFAKWTTTPDENETSLKTAYDFVNETTPVAEKENAEEDNNA